MRETVAAGLERACASARVVAGLAHAAALDDAVARLQLVLHSNDARARTATLRVLGAMAPLLRARLTVRHTVVRAAVVAALALQAAHALGDTALPHCAPAAELTAALRAAARLAAAAPPFARVLGPVLRALLCGSHSSGSTSGETPTLAVAVEPVAAVGPRCACVAALGAVWRDPVLAAGALALCRALVLARAEAPAVRCCAARTAAALGRHSAVGVPRALDALRAALATEEVLDPRVAACVVACVGALERELLVPVRGDARLLCAVAQGACPAVGGAAMRARTAALAALAVFAPAAPHDAALADGVAHTLAVCTAVPALAAAALDALAPFADAPAVAAAYHQAAATASASTGVPPQVFWAPTFAPAWRRELVDAAAAAATAGSNNSNGAAAAAFLRRCALVARGTAGGRVTFCELLAPHAARLADTAAAACTCTGAEAAADIAAALVVGGAPDACVARVLARVLDAPAPWAVYRVLRVALGEGRAALCAHTLPLLVRGRPALATPFRAWLRALTLVARAETLLLASVPVRTDDDSDDDEDDDDSDDIDGIDDDPGDATVRTQRAVALLLRAVGVLEGRVAPRVGCAAQTALLRLRVAALAAGGAREALEDVARAYERHGVQARLSAHSRAVLAATAQHCRALAQGSQQAEAPCGLWYPPSFFVLRDSDNDDGDENDEEGKC